MKYKFLLVTLLFAVAVLNVCQLKAQANAPKESKISAMVKQMTLEEKVGQMAQVSN